MYVRQKRKRPKKESHNKPNWDWMNKWIMLFIASQTKIKWLLLQTHKYLFKRSSFKTDTANRFGRWTFWHNFLSYAHICTNEKKCRRRRAFSLLFFVVAYTPSFFFVCASINDIRVYAQQMPNIMNIMCLFKRRRKTCSRRYCSPVFFAHFDM